MPAVVLLQQRPAEVQRWVAPLIWQPQAGATATQHAGRCAANRSNDCIWYLWCTRKESTHVPPAVDVRAVHVCAWQRRWWCSCNNVLQRWSDLCWLTAPAAVDAAAADGRLHRCWWPVMQCAWKVCLVVTLGSLASAVQGLCPGHVHCAIQCNLLYCCWPAARGKGPGDSQKLDRTALHVALGEPDRLHQRAGVHGTSLSQYAQPSQAAAVASAVA